MTQFRTLIAKTIYQGIVANTKDEGVPFDELDRPRYRALREGVYYNADRIICAVKDSIGADRIGTRLRVLQPGLENSNSAAEDALVDLLPELIGAFDKITDAAREAFPS